jgi:hypothetical protein
MLAPPEAPRNAEGAQSEGRVGGGRPSTPVQRGQQYKHYKGRALRGSGPKEDGTGILLVLGFLKPRKSFAERHILLDRAPGLPI